VDAAYAVGKFYSSLNNILNVLGKQRNEMLAVHLVKTYCIPKLLYGCEVWSVRPVDMRSVDVAWNNSFHKICNACWWESVKPLQFYCSSLPVVSLLVYRRRVTFWLKMLNSNNLALHALANCCKDSIIGTLEKYRVDGQLNLVSASEYLIKEYFWKHFSCYYM